MKDRTQTINLLKLIEARGVPQSHDLKKLFKNTLTSMWLKAREANDDELTSRIDDMINKLSA